MPIWQELQLKTKRKHKITVKWRRRWLRRRHFFNCCFGWKKKCGKGVREIGECVLKASLNASPQVCTYLNFKWIILCNSLAHTRTSVCLPVWRVFFLWLCVCGVYNKNKNNNNKEYYYYGNCARITTTTIDTRSQGSLFEQSTRQSLTFRTGTQRRGETRRKEKSSPLFCALLPPGMRCSPTAATTRGVTTPGDRDAHKHKRTHTPALMVDREGEETLL